MIVTSYGGPALKRKVVKSGSSGSGVCNTEFQAAVIGNEEKASFHHMKQSDAAILYKI